MGKEHTFYDYTEEGDNVVHAWLNTLPVKVKQKLNRLLEHLEALPVGSWKRPVVETLTGECDGLFEIRTSRSGIRYRLLGWHGPVRRRPTLLHGFAKKGAKVPPAECSTALARKELVESDHHTFRQLHRYD